MGEVFFFNYSTCTISNDGKYLLPDSISLSPILESKIDLYSEFFDHWDDYTSLTSLSINLEMGTFFSNIGRKFSSEYGTIKSRQVNDNSKTARALIKSRLYTVKVHATRQPAPPSIQVEAVSLLSRLFAMATNRDGTHYVTTLDAGGVLSQIDHLDSSYVNSQDTTKLAAAVGVDFFSKFSISAYAHVTTNQSNYQENRKSSQLITMGGPRYRGNFTLQYWEDGLPNALVATDRSGNPLHFCITPTALPDLPPTSVLQTADSVFNAINRYYKVNTRYGCTDPGSKNFNFQAHVDDNSCGVKSTNFTFGGLFQTCVVLNGEIGAQCNGLSQVNPLTGNYSCPNGYTPVRLRSGITTGTRYVTLPPFSPVPQPKFNVTRTLVVGDYDGGIWVKGQDGTWSKSAQGGTDGLQKLADTNHTASCNSTSTSTAPLSQDNAGSSSGMLEGVGETSGAPSSSELSSGEVAAASVGSLVGAGIIIAMMLLFGKLIYRKYTKPQSSRGEMHTQSVGDDNMAQYSRLVVNNRADTTNTA
eukprot:Em0002g1050a